MRAALISVGSELTLGLTVDTNSAWLAARLAEMGYEARRHVTVGDDWEEVAEEIRRAAATADLVVVTGGLGPTLDDTTREALAEAMGVPLQSDPEALEQIRAFFRSRDRTFSESNARQALVPEGATPLRNAWGTAPGILAEMAGTEVYCLPGVPYEMREMFSHAVWPRLQRVGTPGVVATLTVPCFGAGESRIAEQIADLMQAGREVTVGTTAAEGMIDVRLCSWASSEEAARAVLGREAEEVRRRLGTLVIGAEGTTLEAEAGRLLGEQNLTVSTAESCTGGLLAKRLTDVPGSSAYFLRGVVTYSNRAKVDLLGVAAELIERHGAVSAEVAQAMAVGCHERSGTDLAVSTTGVAGPSGGTETKPVGLVYVALASREGCEFRELKLGGHLARESIRERTCSTALNMLRLRLLG
jgi:nicotinamide-nucleotide amidase